MLFEVPSCISFAKHILGDILLPQTYLLLIYEKQTFVNWPLVILSPILQADSQPEPMFDYDALSLCSEITLSFFEPAYLNQAQNGHPSPYQYLSICPGIANICQAFFHSSNTSVISADMTRDRNRKMKKRFMAFTVESQ